MIEVEGLKKSYGGLEALAGLSFAVGRGEVVGFLGPNGAGKSTTMRILAGVLAPTAGSARVGGLDAREKGLEVRALVGYLPENNPLYEELETAEYLEWCARARGLRGALLAQRVKAAAAACSLSSVLDRPLGLLSKGFRQRAGLAAAIVHDPPVLLLDEPTSGLDPNQAREVRELIMALKAEKTVLLSTHILSEVRAVCDRAIILSKGRIAAQGTLAELSGTRTPRVTVSVRAEDAAKDALAGLGALEELPAPEGEARYRVETKEDVRAAVFTLAKERGWTLLELGREEASLEDVFRELAGEDR